MTKLGREKLAKFFGIMMTSLMCIGMSFLVFKQWNSQSNENSASEQTQNPNNSMQTEIITNEQVEKELNTIASEKIKIEQTIIQDKKRAAEKIRLQKAAEQKAIQDKADAIEKAAQAAATKAANEKAAQAAATKAANEKAAQAAATKAANEKAAQAAATKAANEKAAQAAAQAQAAINKSQINKALAGYGQLVITHITPKWDIVQGSNDLRTIVYIKLDTKGNVIGKPKITQSSGNDIFDQSVLSAILKSSPLPMPTLLLAREQIAKEGLEIVFKPN